MEFVCDAKHVESLDIVIDLVSDNQDNGSADVFARAVCALAQLDADYYAKHPTLRHTVVNRLRTIFSVRSMTRFQPAMYALLDKLINQVYYVHSAFEEEVEDDADFQWAVAIFDDLNISDVSEKSYDSSEESMAK